jgi:hypothetical protein
VAFESKEVSTEIQVQLAASFDARNFGLEI